MPGCDASSTLDGTFDGERRVVRASDAMSSTQVAQVKHPQGMLQDDMRHLLEARALDANIP